MFLESHQGRLELPASLRAKMRAFRRRVWTIKMVEAGCGAVIGVGAAYLATFGLDRLWDTPPSLRAGIFAFAVVTCAIVPVALHRWLWRQRRLEQLARLLGRGYPSIGDQLLGIIELARSESEQARSITLCAAAIEQVSEQAASRDFSAAVPSPKHRPLGALALAAAAMALALLAIFPAAATNAWARFLAPWRDTPRYTFTKLEALPDRLVVAHGEPFTFPMHLAQETVSVPRQGEIRIGGQQPVVAPLANNAYSFDLLPQIDAAWLHVRIGDFTKRLRLEPTLRPEVSSATADITLPAYLGRPASTKKDVRGGALSLVHGSRVSFAITATRELAAAEVDGKAVSPRGATVVGPEMRIECNRQVEFQWQDPFGLKGKEPLVLTVHSREDQPPSLSCDGLPTRRVVLDREHLDFKVTAQDDYGVKRVGMEWRGIDKTNFKNPAAGETMLSAGGPDKELLEINGAFQATALGIEAQPIQVRLFVEDFYPKRPRVYSPPYVLYVLTPEQHAIWLSEQLSKWQRQALDVRDKEMQLFETNKQLRQLSVEEINRAEVRRKIETQAEAERTNGRRLTNLVASGEDLIKQAMRNPEFGVGHLEKWAAMLQVLKDISGNRMPSVADLLQQAAQAPAVAQNSPRSKMAGQVRANVQGKAGAGKQQPKKNPVPSVVDIESTQQRPDPKEQQQASNKSGGGARLGLPTTMIPGSAKAGDSCPVNQKMDEAVTKQQDLLAEFDKIADELNRLLANLEGSTLVKRLKAASRLQGKVAGRLTDQVNSAFGVPAKKTGAGEQKLFKELADQEGRSSQDMSNIMDDIQSYFERRRYVQFKTVLDDMRHQDVIDGLRRLGDDLRKEAGLSVAQCEFWSDTMDRWADELVDPASGGS